jgi:hypothetical protein
VPGHGLAGAGGEAGRVLGGGVGHVLEGDPGGQVGERVVGRGLVGDDVDGGAQGEEPRHGLGGVAQQADGERPAPVAGLGGEAEGVFQAVGPYVEVAVLDTAVDGAGVAVDADRDAVVHGDGEGLGAAHAAEAGGEGDGPGEGAAELLGGDGGEGLVGALEDALGADVDPGTGRHLPVHGQAEGLQAAELLPVGPVTDEVGVGDEDARGPFVGLHDADRPARLDEHRLVLLEGLEGADHRVEGPPVAGGLSRPAVDDELVGVLGDLRVEVVLQHAQGGLLLPSRGAELRASRCADGAGS